MRESAGSALPFTAPIAIASLAAATAALRDGIERNGYEHAYKHHKTTDFLIYIWTYVYQHFFFIPKANIKP